MQTTPHPNWDLSLFIYNEVPAICQWQFKFSFRVTSTQEGFSGSKCIFSVICLFLSNLEDSVLSCDFISLTDLRKVIDFSVCSAPYLLQWNGAFQYPYLLSQTSSFDFYPSFVLLMRTNGFSLTDNPLCLEAYFRLIFRASFSILLQISFVRQTI